MNGSPHTTVHGLSDTEHWGSNANKHICPKTAQQLLYNWKNEIISLLDTFFLVDVTFKSAQNCKVLRTFPFFFRLNHPMWARNRIGPLNTRYATPGIMLNILAMVRQATSAHTDLVWEICTSRLPPGLGEEEKKSLFVLTLQLSGVKPLPSSTTS